MALLKPRASRFAAAPAVVVPAAKAALRLNWTIKPELNAAWTMGRGLRATVSKLDESYLRHHSKVPGARLAWRITADFNWDHPVAEGETAPGCLDLEAAMLAVEAEWYMAELFLMEEVFNRRSAA